MPAGDGRAAADVRALLYADAEYLLRDSGLDVNQHVVEDLETFELVFQKGFFWL